MGGGLALHPLSLKWCESIQGEDVMKVFIADDSTLLVERLASVLAQLEGVEVVGRALDVPGAAESIIELIPDVVVLDLKMPGGSGFDVLREVKRERPSVRVVVLTNHAGAEYRERCITLGADFFISKTEKLSVLSDIVSRLAAAGAKDV